MTDPLKMYLADIFTNAANLAGICGISLPCGFAEMDGKRLPVGLQLLGKALDEQRILQIANAFEQDRLAQSAAAELRSQRLTTANFGSTSEKRWLPALYLLGRVPNRLSNAR